MNFLLGESRRLWTRNRPSDSRRSKAAKADLSGNNASWDERQASTPPACASKEGQQRLPLTSPSGSGDRLRCAERAARAERRQLPELPAASAIVTARCPRALNLRRPGCSPMKRAMGRNTSESRRGGWCDAKGVPKLVTGDRRPSQCRQMSDHRIGPSSLRRLAELVQLIRRRHHQRQDRQRFFCRSSYRVVPPRRSWPTAVWSLSATQPSTWIVAELSGGPSYQVEDVPRPVKTSLQGFFVAS